MQLLLAAAAAAAAPLVTAAAPPKMITTILIDDLGSYDTAVNNPDIAWLTPNLERLSHAEGLRLNRYYVNKFCSPTRRSYLTGRFPVSVSMIQAQPCENALPLGATLLSEKLKKAPTPWANHFVGKGHLGCAFCNCLSCCVPRSWPRSSPRSWRELTFPWRSARVVGGQQTRPQTTSRSTADSIAMWAT
jgi:hypothetical protein